MEDLASKPRRPAPWTKESLPSRSGHTSTSLKRKVDCCQVGACDHFGVATRWALGSLLAAPLFDAPHGCAMYNAGPCTR